MIINDLQNFFQIQQKNQIRDNKIIKKISKKKKFTLIKIKKKIVKQITIFLNSLFSF